MTLHHWDETYPRVTTIITSYNYAQYLPYAIDSALDQDYPNHEVLILDNCSTDGSREVIRRYESDPRVRAVYNEENIGLIGNYNRGVELASGTYVVLLSADDVFFRGHLRQSIEYYRANPDIDLMYTPYYVIDGDGAALARDVAYGVPDVDAYEGRNEFADMLQFDNYMYLPSVLVHRDLYREYGAFRSEIPIAADYEICLRWAAAGKRFGFLNNPAVAMRRHDANRSGVAYIRSGAQATEHLWILQRYLTGENRHLYAGRELDIQSMLNAKMSNLMQYKEERADTLAALQPALQDVAQRLQASIDASTPDPLVSVIVPFCGNLRFLQDALDSIRAQTYAAWEAIVVQDGGPDVRQFFHRWRGDRRICYARKNRTEGPGSARNDAFKLAAGQVVAYLDDDNVWHPQHLDTVMQAMRAANQRIAVTRARCIIETLADDGEREQLLADDAVYAIGPDNWPLHTQDAVPLNCVAHTRICLSMTGGFSSEPAFEDLDFLIRLSQKFSAAVVNATTVEIRNRTGFRGQRLGTSWKSLIASLETLFGKYTSNAPAIVSMRAEYLANLRALTPKMPNDVASTRRALAALAGSVS